MEPDEGGTKKQLFQPVLRRADIDSGDGRPVRQDSRWEYAPILSEPPPRSEPDHRIAERARDLLGPLVIVAFLAAGAVAVSSRTAPPEPPAVPQELLAGARGPMEARDGPPFSQLSDNGTTEATRSTKPRSVRVTVRAKGGRRSGKSARSSRITLAGGTSAPAKGGSSAGASGKGSGSSPKKKSGGSTAASKAPPQPSRALYHLYKGGNRNDHWFTISPTDRDDRIARGYELVRVEGYVFGRAEPGTTPLNTDNGLAGFIYAEPRDGFIPLYMLRGYNGYGDLFTSDESRLREYEEEGWNPYGIVGYVLPAS